MIIIPEKIHDASFDEIFRYIYLVKIGDNPRFFNDRSNSYKIGYSNNLRTRISTLQFEHQSTIDLIAYGISRNHIRSESYLHTIFKQYKRYGEYFDFNEETISKFIAELKKICIDVKDGSEAA